METLVKVNPVEDKNDVKGLRKIYVKFKVVLEIQIH